MSFEIESHAVYRVGEYHRITLTPDGVSVSLGIGLLSAHECQELAAALSAVAKAMVDGDRDALASPATGREQNHA